MRRNVRHLTTGRKVDRRKKICAGTCAADERWVTLPSLAQDNGTAGAKRGSMNTPAPFAAPYVDIPLDEDPIPVGEASDSDFGAFIDAVEEQTQQPRGWPGAPLTAVQLRRHQAQVDAMRAGKVARWPEGLL